tara:strand:- start:567 stop:1721 length:1155 start_codon:yes stop_codon:yes gene_type:complete
MNTVLRKIKSLMVYLFNLPLYWIASYIPKNENIWIFGTRSGLNYTDNSKYLFEYVNKHHPEITAVWLTSRKNIYNMLRTKGYTCYYRYSLKAIWIGLKAGYSVFSNSNISDNMLYLNNRSTKLIQLWHGAPIKKIFYDNHMWSKFEHSKLKKKIFPFLIEKYDLIIALSAEDQGNFKSAFKSKQVFITGYPRNDIIKKETNKKLTITYLPTFRGSYGSNIDLLSRFGFNSSLYDNWLKNNNATLNIQLHPDNMPDKTLLQTIRDTCIVFLSNIDSSEIINQTDILITDYSSVFFDFLLTDLPIIFAPFDHDNYIKKDREFYYDYSAITPGPKCNNWNDILDWIELFKNDPSHYSIERKIIKNRFHFYQDNNSCERVYNTVRHLK